MTTLRQKECLVTSCNRAAEVKGYCNLHYLRFRRGADLQRPPFGTAQPVEVFQYYVARSRTVESTGCVVWKGPLDARGYPHFWSGGRKVLAHRFAWEAANGRTAGTKLVCHMCDTPSCVNPEHLILGTHGENSHDAIARGRLATKLSPEKVYLIRKALSGQRVLQSDLAAAFGVSQSLISRVLNDEVWAHVSHDHTH